MIWDCNWVDDQITIPSSGNEGEVNLSKVTYLKCATASNVLCILHLPHHDEYGLLRQIEQNRIETPASWGNKRGWWVSSPAGYYHLPMMAFCCCYNNNNNNKVANKPPLHLQFVEINLHQEEFLQHLKFNPPASRISTSLLSCKGSWWYSYTHQLTRISRRI